MLSANCLQYLNNVPSVFSIGPFSSRGGCEMRREGACEVGGKRDATWEAKQAAVCVHVNTQGGSFRGDEAYFALQS